MLKWLLLKAIRTYQRTGGSRRWFGIGCNYLPTCSEYTRQAIEQCGVQQGVRAGWHRIRGCRQHDSYCICYDPFNPAHASTPINKVSNDAEQKRR